MKTLITAATTAAAYKLKSQLKGTDIILGDHLDLPGFMLKGEAFIKLPSPSIDTYAHQMLTLCLDSDIETVYLLNEQEVAILFKSEQLFKEYNITLVNGQAYV